MESKEEKIKRLRLEKEQNILKKKSFAESKEFYFDDTGNLCRKSEFDTKKLYIGMLVRIRKPDGNFRNGLINSIQIENKTPKIIVVCGDKKIKFEKNWFEIYPDNRLNEIVEWQNLEIPERLKKMTTSRLLKEFRQIRKSYDSIDDRIYKKELYLREHIGSTNKKSAKKIRQKKAKTKNGKCY